MSHLNFYSEELSDELDIKKKDVVFTKFDKIPSEAVFLISMYLPFTSILSFRLSCSDINKILMDPILYKLKYLNDYAKLEDFNMDSLQDQEKIDWVSKYRKCYFEDRAFNFGNFLIYQPIKSKLDSIPKALMQNQQLVYRYINDTSSQIQISSLGMIPVRCSVIKNSTTFSHEDLLFSHSDIQFLQIENVQAYDITDVSWISVDFNGRVRGFIAEEELRPFSFSGIVVKSVKIISQKFIVFWIFSSSGNEFRQYRIQDRNLKLVSCIETKISDLSPSWCAKFINKKLYLFTMSISKQNIYISYFNSKGKWNNCPLPKKVKKQQLEFVEFIEVFDTNFVMITLKNPITFKFLILFYDYQGFCVENTPKYGKVVSSYWTYKNMICLLKGGEFHIIRFIQDQKGVFIEDVFNLDNPFKNRPIIDFDQSKFLIYFGSTLYIYCLKTGHQTKSINLRQLIQRENLGPPIKIQILCRKWIHLTFLPTYDFQFGWLFIELKER